MRCECILGSVSGKIMHFPTGIELYWDALNKDIPTGLIASVVHALAWGSFCTQDCHEIIFGGMLTVLLQKYCKCKYPFPMLLFSK